MKRNPHYLDSLEDSLVSDVQEASAEQWNLGYDHPVLVQASLLVELARDYAEDEDHAIYLLNKAAEILDTSGALKTPRLTLDNNEPNGNFFFANRLNDAIPILRSIAASDRVDLREAQLRYEMTADKIFDQIQSVEDEDIARVFGRVFEDMLMSTFTGDAPDGRGFTFAITSLIHEGHGKRPKGMPHSIAESWAPFDLSVYKASNLHRTLTHDSARIEAKLSKAKLEDELLERYRMAGVAVVDLTDFHKKSGWDMDEARGVFGVSDAQVSARRKSVERMVRRVDDLVLPELEEV